jgi:hypothetical protein
MQDVEVKHGGCPQLSKQVGCSPLDIQYIDNSTKTFTRCPVCGGELRFGSNDPCEGSYYWCIACGDGPISFPLYGGPKPVRKPIAEIIDAESVQRRAIIDEMIDRGTRR